MREEGKTATKEELEKHEERACAGRGEEEEGEGGEENRQLPLPANSSPHTFPPSNIILVFVEAFRNHFGSC